MIWIMLNWAVEPTWYELVDESDTYLFTRASPKELASMWDDELHTGPPGTKAWYKTLPAELEPERCEVDS